MKSNYDLNTGHRVRYFWNTKSYKSLLKDMWKWLELNDPNWVHNININSGYNAEAKQDEWYGDIIYVERII